jgi:hypothetical protein
MTRKRKERELMQFLFFFENEINWKISFSEAFFLGFARERERKLIFDNPSEIFYFFCKNAFIHLYDEIHKMRKSEGEENFSLIQLNNN